MNVNMSVAWRLPSPAASISAVVPLSAARFVSAPLAASSRSISGFTALAASMKGVAPICASRPVCRSGLYGTNVACMRRGISSRALMSAPRASSALATAI